MIKKYEMQYSIEQKLEDMAILEKIVNGRLNLDTVSDDVKTRLIAICKEQLENVENRIAKNKEVETRNFSLSDKLTQGNYKIIF